MKKILSHRRWLILGLGFCILAALIAFFGGAFATRVYFGEASARGHTTLRLAVAALRGQMGRYESLPTLIADYPAIQNLVADPDNPTLRKRGDEYLKEINTQLDSSDIYVMQADGETIAASNYDLELSFVGKNFSYRPYYTQAMAGEEGRFFALGTTSLKRGYYFSAPIHIENEIRGVVVVKVDIDAVEATWRGGDSEIIVSGPEGIIFMASRRDWLYSSLLPLTPQRLARTAATRRYEDAKLRNLPISEADPAGPHQLVTITLDDSKREYLMLSERMLMAGWKVSVLLETSSVRAQALAGVITAILLVGLATLTVAILLQRRARLAERMEMQRTAQEELERRVAERTADLAAVNRRLKTEVAERRTTEQQLRQTQSDLVQAGKLAALGQMSAALSHEFNQPLSAARAYADNAAILIDRKRIAEARENVGRIASLVDRMAAISKHLRNFARKPNEKLRPVNLEEIISDTLEIVAWRLKAADAEVTVDIGSTPLVLLAGSVRLQQVLVNIISNAADAVEGLEDRRIELSARRKGAKVLISVRDRGPGVSDAIAARIFDPFFSTKGVGKGLGLGLSISYNIIKDFGGSLTASRHPEGGALLTIELDAARPSTRPSAHSSTHEAAE